MEGIPVILGGHRDYIPAATATSGAAREARYPAGTLGDIQVVTEYVILRVSLSLSLTLSPSLSLSRSLARSLARSRSLS